MPENYFLAKRAAATSAAPAENHFLAKRAARAAATGSETDVTQQDTPAAGPQAAAQDVSHPVGGAIGDFFGLQEDPTGQLSVDLGSPPKGGYHMPDYADIKGDSAMGTFAKRLFATPAKAVEAVLEGSGPGFLGGVRNAAVGIGTLPLDVAGSMGVPGANNLADTIRKKVPQIRQPNAVGDVVQTVIQYASPAARLSAASKAQAAKMGAGKIMQNLAATGGAVAGDIAATDPNQASTLGDLIGGNFPTAVNRDDSPLEKRIKVGAETAAIEPVVTAGKAVVKGTKAVVGRAKEMVAPYTKAGQEKIASDFLKSQTADIPKAVENIDQTTEAMKDSGVRPMVGDASADPRLIALQNRSANSTVPGSAGEAPIDRVTANNEAVAKQFDTTTARSATGDPGQLRPAAEAQAAEQLAPGKAKLDRYNEALTRVKADMESAAADAAKAKGGKVAASEKIDATVRDVEANMTKAKNELFAAVDPDETLRKDATDLIDRVKGIKLEELQGAEALPGDIIHDVKRLAGDETEEGAQAAGDAATGGDDTLGGFLAPANKETGEPATVSFRGLVNLRQRLADNIAQARAENQGARVKNLLRIKEIVNDEIDNFADSVDPEAADQLKDAFDYYENEFAPRFKEGAGGKFRQALKSDRPGATPPSATADRFLAGEKGLKERSGDLDRIIEKADNPEAAKTAVRDYLIADMADKVTDGKTINPDRLAKWVEKNAETLKRYPAVREEVVQMQRRVDRGGKVSKDLEAKILEQTKDVQKSEAEVRRSALQYFIDSDDPVAAVDKVMRGTNKAQKMKQILTAARKDSTGKAVDGLRDTVKEWMRQNLTNTGETLSGGSRLSAAKLDGVLNDNDTVAAIEALGDPQTVQQLRRLRKTMNVLARHERVQGTAGSSTAPLRQQSDELRTVIASAIGITQGRGVFQLGTWIQRAFKKDPQPIIERLVTDAILDPQLAKAMLTRADDAGKIPLTTEKQLRTYISNNILGQTEDRENDNKPLQK